jgi:hypothetical protein
VGTIVFRRSAIGCRHCLLGGGPKLGFKLEGGAIGGFLAVSLCHDAQIVRRRFISVNSRVKGPLPSRGEPPSSWPNMKSGPRCRRPPCVGSIRPACRTEVRRRLMAEPDRAAGSTLHGYYLPAVAGAGAGAALLLAL